MQPAERQAGGLLRTSRELFAQGYYAYALIVVAVVWSGFGVEAGLRARFDADHRKPLRLLVRQAEEEELLSDQGWEDGRLDAGRELRNCLIHTGDQPLMPPAMARSMIAASHELVAALFPECAAAGGTGRTRELIHLV